jgi:hypothetical protein
LHRIGEGEGVQGRVPVSEFIAGVELGDAQRRSVSDVAGQFDLGGAASQRF